MGVSPWNSAANCRTGAISNGRSIINPRNWQGSSPGMPCDVMATSSPDPANRSRSPSLVRSLWGQRQGGAERHLLERETRLDRGDRRNAGEVILQEALVGG